MRRFVYCAAFFACALPALGGLVATNFISLCNTTNACPTIVSQPTTLNYSNTIVNGANSITVTGFADENLTTLALKASGMYSEPSQETFYTELGIIAQLSDTFIISDPRLTGTIGYLEMPFSFTGTVTGPSAFGGLEVIVGDSVGGSSGACTLNVSACLFVGNASVLAGDPATGPMTFHYGSPFTLTWGLAPTFFPQQATSGSSDYSHTAVFQGFRLFDSNQQAVYDATIVGSGGEQVALLTPEPSFTVPVIAVCLVWMGLAKGLFRQPDFRPRFRR